MNCLAEALGSACPATAPSRPLRTAQGSGQTGRQASCGDGQKQYPAPGHSDLERLPQCYSPGHGIGGSSNTVLHLLAIAYEADVPLELEVFDEISTRVPNICKLSPGGLHRLFDLFEAGGISAVLKQLADQGLLEANEITVTGKTLGENISRAAVKNPEVIRPLNDPYTKEGGIAILRGNLAPDGAVVKQSAVAREMLVHSRAGQGI